MTDQHTHPGALDQTVAGRPGRGPAPGQPGATQTEDPRTTHPELVTLTLERITRHPDPVGVGERWSVTGRLDVAGGQHDFSHCYEDLGASGLDETLTVTRGGVDQGYDGWVDGDPAPATATLIARSVDHDWLVDVIRENSVQQVWDAHQDAEQQTIGTLTGRGTTIPVAGQRPTTAEPVEAGQESWTTRSLTARAEARRHGALAGPDWTVLMLTEPRSAHPTFHAWTVQASDAATAAATAAVLDQAGTPDDGLILGVIPGRHPVDAAHARAAADLAGERPKLAGALRDLIAARVDDLHTTPARRATTPPAHTHTPAPAAAAVPTRAAGGRGRHL